MKSAALSVALYLATALCFAQSEDSIKTYTTTRVAESAPTIDGIGNDPAWALVPWGGGDFRQLNPDAGAPASVQTEFKILYDLKNLYVLIRNHDPEPDKIVSRMSRRDGFEGDFVEINIDSYFDKRTAFSFTASVSGVKGDEYVSNNGDNWDESWDPIWYLKTSIDSTGWVAEMRIPLSQLRFADKPDHVWGIQFTRRFFRNQERSNWQYIPPSANGWVHLFGELHGISGIKPQKQLEIQPYIVTKAERFEEEPGNPYATGKHSRATLGLDAKIGITSDITLDLTVNPDFGQVEADPSQVNLTAFELYFQERRPFFIEGSNTLDFPVSDFGSNKLFYSRRIGRRPQGYADPDRTGSDGVDEYVKPNTWTTILGAAKLTGKNKKGFSWGLLETVTAVERAEIDSLGYKREQVIEPLTNYLVGRVQQDINKGNTIVGAMLTATNRKIDDPYLNYLRSDAYSGGIDFVHNWKDRKYYVSGKTVVSHVKGSPESITAAQYSSLRYFQRPDNHHANIDSTRTSLTGTGGTFVGGKRSGKLVFDIGFTWKSPELELNDVGFLSQTDEMTQWFWMQYRILNPVKIFRSQRYNINQWENFDFDWRSTARGWNFNGHVQFQNFWGLSTGATYETHSISNADLRGGPSIKYPGGAYYWLWIGTDRRKKFSVEFNPEWRWGNNRYVTGNYYWLNINYTPINAFKITIQPNLGYTRNEMQYVSTSDANGEVRYIVGEIRQTTARVSIRATFMLTPNLSIQYWGQPFGAIGEYSNFKYITDAAAAEYSQRYMPIPKSWLSDSADEYFVDENNDGSSDVSFRRPDFNFGQFRSNMVLRWEYIPGSTFFLVWTQERNGGFYDDSGAFYNRYSFDFRQRPHNVFLMKFTYRFVR